MIKFFKKQISLFLVITFFVVPVFSFGENIIHLNGPSLIPSAQIFLTPRTGNFIVGSTFEVPIYLDTKNNSINAINIKLNFDASKLSIINPSGGKSIFGLWVEPPSYDNKKGTISLVGLIPNGIVTSSGLIATMTFKAINPGEARIFLSDQTSVNLNDGLGTSVKVDLSGALFSIFPQTPEGVTIYSETHPIESNWYNNNSPLFKWDNPLGTEGYNVVLDVNPGTIPKKIVNTNSSSAYYEELKDGIWYFHVRTKINGVWGNTSHFQTKIDTKSPAEFKPETSSLKDSSGKNKYLISFLTTDSLSGVSYYEVGIIEEIDGEIESPIFIQTKSPYLVPHTSKHTMKVLIRAFDHAGNMQEVSLSLFPGYNLLQKLDNYGLYILLIIIFLLLLELILHYLFGHHILDHFRRAYRFFKKISTSENKEENIPNNDENPL